MIDSGAGVGVGFLWGASTMLQRAREVRASASDHLTTSSAFESVVQNTNFFTMKETLLPYRTSVPKKRVDTIARCVFGIAAVSLLFIWVRLVLVGEVTQLTA